MKCCQVNDIFLASSINDVWSCSKTVSKIPNLNPQDHVFLSQNKYKKNYKVFIKINVFIKQIEDQWGNRRFNSTINQILTDTYKILRPTTVKYTFFWSAHKTFFNVDQMLGCKTSFNTLIGIDIIQSMFSNQQWMKLGINDKRTFVKFIIMWKLNNTLLENWAKEEIRRKNVKYLETNESATY